MKVEDFMKRILFIWMLSIVPTMSIASPAWRAFLQEVRIDAIQAGVRPATADRIIRTLHEPSRKVMKYDRNQPEKRLTFLKYRNTRADAYRIKIGHTKFAQNKQLLTKIGHEYGVSPCFIASFWGLETSYGHFMGSFPVLQSLATLAFDSRRSAFFRKELIIAMEIVDQGHVDLDKFKGEWAGASGQPQFLPSSWKHFAVDYNGNGKRDIWKEKGDIFASIANYLRLNGWEPNAPWAIVVTTPSGFPEKLMSRNVKKSVSEWLRLGVKPVKHAVPNDSRVASIIRPYGGPTMMIFNNFNVIMKWNRSTYYAGTVGYMAEKLCRHKL